MDYVQWTQLLVKSSLTKRKRNGTCCHLDKYENISLWLLECNRSSPFQIYCVRHQDENTMVKNAAATVSLCQTLES